MKTPLKTLCNLIPVILVVLCMTSCTGYTEQTIADFNKLKSPVILIGKKETWGLYSIVVKDANDSIRYYGNLSGMATAIGKSRQIGDTLK